MRLPNDSDTERPRISLTWRAIALTSLLLLGIASVFTLISHDSLTEQFHQSRESIYQSRQREFQQVIARSNDTLTQLASLAAASDRLGAAVRANSPTRVTLAIDPVWPTLQLDVGVDEMRIFNDRGQVLAARGQPLPGDTPPFDGWTRQVMRKETPLSTLRCLQDCRQYTVVPVLAGGASVGVVVLSRSLADLTRYARSMAQSDVALLVAERYSAGLSSAAVTPPPTTASGVPGERYLAAWRGSLITLTHQDQNLPILRDAARQAPLSRLTEGPWNFAHRGRTYELAAVPMNDSAEFPSRGYLLLISDITEQVEAIRRDTRHSLTIALLGWLAAEGLLLLILWRPMARLRDLAVLLPRLAQRDFDGVQRSLARDKRHFTDEIDTLERTTLELAGQLESLEHAVSSRDQELTRRLAELSVERDFVSGLLDTARVLILTQDEQGRITLVNRFTETVTGYDADALMGRRFAELFRHEHHGHERLPLPPQEHASQEEGELLTARRESRIIAWYHAPIPGQGQHAGTLISVGLDITERKRAEERLAWLAHRDPLTDLYNRRFFQDALERALTIDAQGAVLFLDLDQFKEVNELSGHNAGDQLLRLVARALAGELEDEAIIARLGGDEFSILLENADAHLACRVAERIVRVLEEIDFSTNGRRHRAVASIGIALYPEHGSSQIDLMAGADLAMYKAKENSSQRWHLLSTVVHSREELRQRVYWVERIRQALRENDFELVLQPIRRLTDDSIRHYEALLRMHGDNGALVMPGLFIPIAERSGQIVELDRWVLRESLGLLARLQRHGVSLAVNLSGQSLHDANLTEFLERTLVESGADPQRLILEVTETAAVTDFATARGVLQGIRDLGCQTALDDFGVGFSSFHYLGQLPADYIKIDGSFIQKLLDSPEDRLIVKAIADIANGFGKRTIAEFVDQARMLPLLEQYGITYAQGYYIGRPVPASEVLAIWRRRGADEHD
ncbi:MULTISPECIES: EAL domain-containing protein [unclassified Modicisalibacter]|uniref:bifunctional diguanylate cyclase/phosphodiesterase n=1 Tax=unclassified Modicisalibacter TaxID=2679913 RepID=UPI001CCB499C|nr:MULTISPECIES: EAL domain-containing protein [unclassified Modicisalibacter]MBZ9559622.1 EAL domain-containing protein [Modicisalibacter sp. R2A 31.J]MBZ9577074.1 EAL domain-containing protein [Modicisalibacter sp. MOD 31.J]